MDRLAAYRRKPCPSCGTRAEPMFDNAGAAGIMLNCTCGARCRIDDWIDGRVTLMRQEDGTYEYTDPGRPVPPHGSGP